MFDDEYEHVFLDDLFLMQSHIYLDSVMFVFLPCILAAIICCCLGLDAMIDVC